MNPRLMYRDRDFELVSVSTPTDARTRMSDAERVAAHGRRRSGTEEASDAEADPPEIRALVQDLELNTLFGAMAGEDAFLFAVARQALLTAGENDIDTIRYRQAVLQDCLMNPQVVTDLYALALEGIDAKRQEWWGIFQYPTSTLHSSVALMRRFHDILTRLRAIADRQTGFRSDAFTSLYALLQRELTDEYLARVREHLDDLKFRSGVLLSVRLGDANQGTSYVLRAPNVDRRTWLSRLVTKGPPGHTFHIHERDEAGGRAVAEIRDRGINLVANALAQSADHVLGFFTALRTELAFYLGCVNLHRRLAARTVPLSFPTPIPAQDRRHHVVDLHDVCLSLTTDQPVVGNTFDAESKSLVIVTGANQGGKSTFLRSIGLGRL